MKAVHFMSVIRIGDEIAVIQGLMAGLLGLNDLSRVKETLAEFAVLKDRLASLRMERRAFLNDL